MSGQCRIKMLLAIMPRGKGDAVVDFLRERNILFNVLTLGRGADCNRFYDILGLSDCKKDVVISVLDGGLVKEVLEELAIKFKLHEEGHGIAFTIGINSVSCKRILNYFTGLAEERK